MLYSFTSDAAYIYIYICVCVCVCVLHFLTNFVKKINPYLRIRIVYSNKLIIPVRISNNYFVSIYTTWNKSNYIINIFILTFISCPVGWRWKINRQLLCRGVRTPPQRVSWYNTKQSDGEFPVMLELWGRRSISSLPSLPAPFWSGVVAPDRVLSMGQIELNIVLMLNWIAWNKTVLTFKLRTYAKLNCLKWNCFCMLNWIVWNESVFDIETVLTLN